MSVGWSPTRVSRTACETVFARVTTPTAVSRIHRSSPSLLI